MSTKVEKFVKTYQTLSRIPAVIGGTIRSNGVVSSIWSQRNLEKGKTSKFIREIFTNDLQKTAEIIPYDISSETLSKTSFSEKFRAVLRENDNKQFLEIWQNNNVVRTVDLSALDVHGSVYSDVEFSSFEWSPDENKILYVAEKKQAKSESFYKRKSPSGVKDSGNGDEEKSKGQEHIFQQDWGEQLVGKKVSVIAEYNIENDTVEILKGVPDDICVAQPKYSPDGSYIIGVAYNIEPRKLGLIYCTNRTSTIFKLDFQGNFVSLQLKGLSVKSPIFTADGDSILWLQRKSGGPHASGMQLVKINVPLTEESAAKVIVDMVDTELKINDEKIFYGLYNTGFLKRPWASGRRLLVNTNQKYTINSYVINIDNSSITHLDFDDGSQIILDVFDDIVLAVRRHFLKPDKLIIGKLPEVGSESNISWIDLTHSETVPGLEHCCYKYLDLKADGDEFVAFNAIYLGPKSGNDKSVPLIVWPHGGPHSAFANNLFLESALFLSFGYAVLLINYRGSLGAGQKSVDFLPGKIGTADVQDCIIATDVALSKFSWLNPNALALAGGSHGGFLVAHLSGQYPEKFKVVVARNPVIDVASMSIISDIPDWCYIEAGKEYSQKGEIDNNILSTMRKVSPIVHAHKVKAPTLLQIGSKDLRVPPHQGTDYYLRLKANGVTTRMNLYDDNHPLGTVPNELDNIINSLLWIEQHLGRD
ncbi:acylamino-acid-releasing enzyme [Leptinotarsa decemlineata]|uniref:acylamino-acid-releasing enzyme n=1 Tax=Leptinotarsa decemlineata TaxID=7539 RepID=UPI003D305DE9